MTVVLDASVTVAWLFADERTPPVVAVLDRVAADGGLVPPVWPLEVANALQIAIRRGRMTRDARDEALASLAALPLAAVQESMGESWGLALAIADHHRLTVYDATYLALALRHGLPLATRDAALGRAALAEGITVLGA